MSVNQEDLLLIEQYLAMRGRFQAASVSRGGGIAKRLFRRVEKQIDQIETQITNIISGQYVDVEAETVPELSTFTTSEVSSGSIGLISRTGRVYIATAATAVDSTWIPTLVEWWAEDFGTTLATSVIQLALDAAAANGLGVVRVGPGIWTRDVELVIKSNLTLQGVGMRATLIRGTAGAVYLRTNAPGFAVSPTVFHARIADIGFDKASGPPTAGSIGIDCRNAQDVVIERVHCTNLETGIRVGDESRSVSVRNCRALACTTGYRMENGVRSSKISLCAAQTSTTAVRIGNGANSSTSNVTVAECSFDGFTDCIVLEGAVGLETIQTNIEHNRIENGTRGVVIDADCRAINVVDNHFQFQSVPTRIDDNSPFGELYSRENTVHNRLQFGSPVDGERRGSLSDYALPERTRYAGFFEDWLSDNVVEGQTNWQAIVSGGSAFWVTTLSDREHPGIVALRTTATATDRASLRKGDSFTRLGGGRVRWETVVKIPILPDATDPFTFRIGLGDSDTADYTDGVYFEASEADANWMLKTASNGARTPLDSNVSLAANTWVVLEANVQAGGGEVEFFINGVSVGTINTNIPTGSGRLCTPAMMQIRNGVGTANRDVLVDCYQYGQGIDALR